MKTDNLFTFLGGVLVGAAVAILFPPSRERRPERRSRTPYDKEYQCLKDKINSLENRAKAAADAYASAKERPAAEDIIAE